MVNRGRSGGCVTCKERRVKCDEAKPECKTCKRLRLRCRGYEATPSRSASLKFKHYSLKSCTTVNLSHRVPQAVALAPPLRDPDTAVSFFLVNFASMGRDISSTSGFFEMLIPVYGSQREGSVLSLAVSAVASELLYMWRHGTRGSFQVSLMPYTQAVAGLRRALQDDSERGKPATVLAVLALQFYETLASAYRLRSATPIHQHGAVSLLPFACSSGHSLDGTISAYLRRFILHTEISSALRQKRPIQSIASSWLRSKQLTAAPENPSAALDVIGASVAEFQATYMQLAQQDSSWALAQVKHLDAQLLAWAQSVPDHWRPVKLISGKDIDPSIPTYRSVCHVYPSCQIASIWNLWYSQRLILVKIALSSLETILCSSPSEPTQDQDKLARMEDFIEYTKNLQELVDSVCHSVPFYLGNRTKMSSLADFSDPSILLPGYPSLAPCDFSTKMDLNNIRFPNPKTTSRDEHKHHVIAQGPWHIMDPLDHLLALLSEDRLLRPGQLEWIRKQSMRVTTLLQLPPPLSESSNS